MESHTAKLDHDYLANQTPTKLSKKEKKKLKEAKKLKNKKLDADKVRLLRTFYVSRDKLMTFSRFFFQSGFGHEWN